MLHAVDFEGWIERFRPAAWRSWVQLTSVALALAATGCTNLEDAHRDGGLDAQAPPEGGARACTADSECDDGRFCNGVERCAPADPAADAEGCLAADAPCAACDEDADTCEDCADADGDGALDAACGGSDCDDRDASRFPGNPEVCDADDRDEDCDPTTFGVRDADGDGETSAACCNEAPDGTRACGTDCDDSRRSVSPLLAEVCDTLDNDCDGEVDEGVLGTFHVDGDGDGHGSSDAGAATRMACSRPDGYASAADDCDDGNAAVNPGTPELCDPARLDEDCDGTANPATLCECDFEGSRSCAELGLSGRCASGNYTCVAGSATACSIMPATEVCEGAVDEDCDGSVDEGLTLDCYPDADNDGYAAMGATTSPVCEDVTRTLFGGCPAFTTNREPVDTSIDCDDADAAISPDRIEICDGRDQNCDGQADETFECAVGATDTCTVCGRDSVQTCNSICRWEACAPLDEVCNGCDDDLDETADQIFDCAVGSSTDIAGDPIVCTTACGTVGTGLCTGMCGAPDAVAGSCQFDCGGASCRADEVCNYCDDDGDGRVGDDRDLASSELFRHYRWSASGAGHLGAEPWGDSDGVSLIDQADRNAAGGVFSSSFQIGYGTVTLNAIALLENTLGGRPADGWALSVLTHPSATGSVGGESGSQLGVPYDRNGYAVEWRVYDGATNSDTDLVSFRALHEDGPDPLIRSADTVPAGDAFDRNDAADHKGLRIVIEPESPILPWESTRIDVYWVNSGVAHLVSWCGGDTRHIGYQACPTAIHPGDRLTMVTSAASGSLVMNVRDVQMRAQAEQVCRP